MKDRQGSILILLVSEPVYSVLQWHRFRICYGCGFQWWQLIHTLKRVFLWTLLSDLNHHLCGIDILFGKLQVRHNEHIGCWTSPPHNTALLAQQHQPLYPLHLPCVWLRFPDEGVGVDHTFDYWCFFPGARTEARGVWHFILWSL